MTKIAPFKKQHQQEIEHLLNEIADEYNEPIALPNSSFNIKTVDKLWVAINDDQVIGTVGIVKISERMAVLKKVFLNKKFRGKEKGVSSLLLQTAINWCLQERMEKIFLGTMIQFKAAQKFYEKNGFQLIDKSKLPKDYIHNPIDEVFYQKSIKE